LSVSATRLPFKNADPRYQEIQAPALAPLELDGRLLAALAVVEAEGAALHKVCPSFYKSTARPWSC
jgi:hypothetical protein